MTTLEIVFWACVVLVGYTYAGYAVVLAVLAKLSHRPPQRQGGYTASVSFVTCAHNESQRIGDRIDELRQLHLNSAIPSEIIVVSDGSTDGTAEEARKRADDNVRVIELSERQGKAAALSTGCASANNEVLVFTDSRQRWDSEALRMILENFADPAVGAVSGDLVLEATPGVMAGVALYWRYEKWLRKKESCLHSTVGVTGAISAVRRSLFGGVPAGTILDDVYWPLCVTMQGHRVVHEKRAIAFDTLPHKPVDEFRRKVRTLAGNFQLVMRLPGALLPWRNPVWFQLVSHKLMRLLVPWALITMLITTAFLPGAVYQFLFWSQIAFYVLALLGNNRAVAGQVRPAAAAASLVVLNAAAWLAFWVWVTGQTGQSWRKVKYVR